MTLSVQVQHRLSATAALDVAFETSGTLTALFGPSGSGKTSLINCVAGLLKPDAAHVVVDGTVLADTARKIFLPVHKRRIGYVFQDARLFPHMTVAENLAYGERLQSTAERRADKGEILSLLGIGALLQRRPNQLSGGEKQRVAIGRALLSSPRLLLMDEPLSSLDAPRKEEIIPHMLQLRDSNTIPILYVSHAMQEVARLAHDVVVLDKGRMTACGPAARVLGDRRLLPEEDRDEASSLLECVITGYDKAYDMTLLDTAAGTFHVPGQHGVSGTRLRLRVRSRDVMLAATKPTSISALNVLAAEVQSLQEGEGPSADVGLLLASQPLLARVTRQSAHMLGIKPGNKVFVIIKAVSVAA